jgi:hypothetical protein
LIERVFEPGTINDLINDPAIRPTIGGEGELDATALVEDRRNVFLSAPGGGMAFIWRGPGIYEGHTHFLCRGGEALHLAKCMIGRLWTDFPVRMVWGLTPVHLRNARWFTRKLGFQSHGVMETPEGPCELFVMEGIWASEI